MKFRNKNTEFRINKLCQILLIGLSRLKWQSCQHQFTWHKGGKFRVAISEMVKLLATWTRCDYIWFSPDQNKQRGMTINCSEHFWNYCSPKGWKFSLKKGKHPTIFYFLCIFLALSAVSTFNEILKKYYTGDNELFKILLWTVFRAQKIIQNLKQLLDTEYG